MAHSHQGTPAFVRRQPELPAFCRTRRQPAVTVHPSRLRRLEWLLWLVFTLQITALLLIAAGPVPAPLHPQPSRLSSGAVGP